MTKTRLLGGVVLVAVVAAFLAGFWPERQRRTALETENAALQSRVSILDERVRVAQLHGALLNLIDAVAEMNYGQAQTQSSTLFDDIRAEAGRMQTQEFQTALGDLLASRDHVTALLAKGDSTVLEPLRQSERQLRQALGAPPPVTHAAQN
jgi:hypothetical protein